MNATTTRCGDCGGPMAPVDSGHYACAACRAVDRAEQDAVARIDGRTLLGAANLPRDFVPLPRAVPVFRADESAMADPEAWAHTLTVLRRRVPGAVVMVERRDRAAVVAQVNGRLAELLNEAPCTACNGTGDNPRDRRDVCDYCLGSGKQPTKPSDDDVREAFYERFVGDERA